MYLKFLMGCIKMNVVIYTRFSPGSTQNEQSTIGQLKVCREFAQKNNWNIINEYIDEAETGTSDNRPQFKRMIEDSSKKTFEGVLVYQLDRFARNRYDSVINKNKLKKNGVRVFSARENISNDASGILMESVLEGMAEYYSVELGQKVKRGMEINAEKCYYNGGKVPIGLKLIEAERIKTVSKSKVLIKKKYAIDEDIAPFVKKVFEMYINGDTMMDIARYLNDYHIKTSKGNEHDVKSVRRILQEKKYLGIYSYDGIEIPGGIPRIIDDNTFNKVSEKMEKNKRNPSRARAKNEYLLTTKLFCGHCKEMMIGHSGTSKTGKLHTYYICKKTREKTCNKKAVQKDYIEDLVVKYARNILTDENINIIANEVIKLAEQEQDNSNINRLNKLLSENEKQRANLFDKLKICDIDSVTKAIFEEIAKMDTEHKQIEAEIEMEERKRTIITIPKIKFFLNDLKKGDINDEKTRRMLVNVLINKIYLYDDKINIFFNTQKEPIDIDVDLLYNIENDLEVRMNEQTGHQKYI